ncbi:MAG: M3 family metallopeptidase [Planctomycetes bacterium]|nr:M3 family metallopeptidase [Planctomycetota bacterium]
MTADNPLLHAEGLPRFTEIQPEHVVPAVKQRIAEVEAELERLMAQTQPRTWANTVAPLEQVEERLERAFGPVAHLKGVLNTDALRDAYNEAEPLLTEHGAKLGQDARLFKAYQEILDQADAEGLDAAQRKVLRDAIRDFKLAGVDLPPEKQERFRAIQVELGQLSSKFSDNLIDADRAYKLVITDPADLAGLPDSEIAAARAASVAADAAAPEQHWTFTLHVPSYLPFMTYAKNRALREELYRARVTRCTQGDGDNSPLIDRILVLRKELSALLGFANYAELSLARKMASSPQEVHTFLSELAERSLPYGQRDREQLFAFARERDGLESLEAWDVTFYREALRQERYSFSDDEVRQYFPLPRVLDGLFATLKRLYDLDVRECTSEIDLWHPDARAYELVRQGQPRGMILTDLFARDGKRQGAWMGDCVERAKRGAGVQNPVAYLVCNFTPPVGDAPSLLRHSEVVTLFHECGHALHHTLTQVDYRQCSGINNVPWDGVELPSQFFENWVWQEESLKTLAGHHETGEPLPAQLLERMLAAKTFMGGADMLRQLEFALFDLELHSDYDPGGARSVHDVLEDVRRRVTVFQPPAYDRFENGFGHIFAGGYAAGYYSYKWAEVLAADAFSRFEEEGLFSPEAGRDFREQILERGGSDDLMQLYVAFRGREPSPDALLRHSGLTEALSTS